jgi:hypothetical protein
VLKENTKKELMESVLNPTLNVIEADGGYKMVKQSKYDLDLLPCSTATQAPCIEKKA